MLENIKKGFTLVEVAISVAIVAVLTALVAGVVTTYATTAAENASGADAAVNQAQEGADGPLDTLSELLADPED